MKSEARKMDMLNGSLADKLLLFAIPLAASSILQQLFNAVDVAVVGHFATNPAEATAAVGCNGPVINLIINLFVGISVGANVVVSNFIGAQDKENANRAVHTAMTLALISGVFLLFLALLISRPMLSAMNTPEAVLPYALQYLRIYALGMPFIMAYNFGAAILRSIGDTKRPLLCLVLSGVINAALNLFLVIVFHLDVAGVAIATVISNVISSVMIWSFLMHEKSEIRLELGRLCLDRRDLSRILRIGVPAGLQSMVFSLSNVIIQSVLNSFGTQAVAGSAVALNYENFSYFVVSSFTQATVTFTSQNYGAGNYERCRKVFRLCITMAMAAAFPGADWAVRDPEVLLGTTVTADNYWKGVYDEANARLMTETYGAPDPYAMSEMEDTAIAVALDRLGMLDRYIVIRDSVNMDVFMNGANPEYLWAGVEDSLASESSVESADIFATAMENNYKVGSVVVDAILDGTL